MGISDALLDFLRGCAGHADENVEHGHNDLWFFFTQAFARC